MKPNHVNPGTTETLGADLERDRLKRRARRIAEVVAASRRQAGGRHTGSEPARPAARSDDTVSVELGRVARRGGKLLINGATNPSRTV